MKMDKENLKKNQFWLLLPLVLLCLVVAFFSAKSLLSAANKEWTKAKETKAKLEQIINNPGDVKPAELPDRLKVIGEQADREKRRLWEFFYDFQNKVEREAVAVPAPREAAPNPDGAPVPPRLPPRRRLVKIHDPLITWPNSPEFDPVRDKDFGEPFQMEILDSKYKQHYPNQYLELLSLLDLVDEEKRAGSVQWGAGGAVSPAAGVERPGFPTPGFPPAAAPVKDTWTNVLTPQTFDDRQLNYKEAWVIQEDLALKREMLKIVAEVNKLMSNLRSEWTEVALPLPEETEKKQEPTPTNGATSSVAEPPGEEKEKEKKEEKKTTPVERKRFYNYTWLTLSAPPPTKDDKNNSARYQMLNWREGWLLDLEIVEEDKQRVLRGASTNYSWKHAIPEMTLEVFLADGPDAPEPPEPVLLTDAGKLEPMKRDAQGKLVSSERKLALVALPERIRQAKNPRIVRVQRRPEQKAWLDHRRVLNPIWLMDVHLTPLPESGGVALEGSVFNRSDRQQKTVKFEVTMADASNQPISHSLSLPGEPVDAGMERPFRFELKDRPIRIVQVRQVLDWKTVPVKRIDRIAIGQEALRESDRMKADPGGRPKLLEAYEFGLRKDPNVPKGAASEYRAKTAPRPAVAPSAEAGEEAPGAETRPTAPTAGVLLPSEKYGIDMRRYYVDGQPLEGPDKLSPEVRRIPLAMVVVVDIDHMNDVLTAFANSRLRIQVTQAPWNRYYNLTPPSFVQPKPPVAGGEFPSVPAPPGVPRPGTKPASATSTEDLNVVQLQVYGIASLYESPDRWFAIEAAKSKKPAVVEGTPP